MTKRQRPVSISCWSWAIANILILVFALPSGNFPMILSSSDLLVTKRHIYQIINIEILKATTLPKGVPLFSGKPTTKRKKATTAKYNPETDGPHKSGPCSILPINEKLILHEKTKLYLEVVLILGDCSDKCKSTGFAMDKARDVAREKRCALRRDPSVIRSSFLLAIILLFRPSST
ncbi:hypothetical protein B0J13DRAFT_529098 [Dactylonectria estremocensis]|uniref:Uncharacterized protein n=1 Tax=Dactylonectria estremocensis TaxID=1079267 RepID=A0A9P9E9M5_9HYPO|nr:hypothetical protein B0J13DRAFT_529098 [Dactylonectria estremocensis]